MGDSIGASALAHIKNMVAERQEITQALQEWQTKGIKNQAALDSFLRFLDIEHSLGPLDQVNPDTGIITRARVDHE